MVRLHLRLEGGNPFTGLDRHAFRGGGPSPLLHRVTASGIVLAFGMPSLPSLGRKCYGSTLALHAISGSSTLPRPSLPSPWRVYPSLMPLGEAFSAALNYILPFGVDLDALMGMLCGNAELTASGAGGNGRFQLSMGCHVPGAREYMDLVYLSLAALLAPRFRAALGPLVTKGLRDGLPVTHWYLESSRSPHWGVLHEAFYADGLVRLTQELADELGGVTFLAHFAMGTGGWDPAQGILFHAPSLHPDSLAPLQSVFLRHGVATASLGGESGCHLLVRREDTASLLGMQALARAHFCPTMLGLAGLGPDGAPL